MFSVSADASSSSQASSMVRVGVLGVARLRLRLGANNTVAWRVKVGLLASSLALISEISGNV